MLLIEPFSFVKWIEQTRWSWHGQPYQGFRHQYTNVDQCDRLLDVTIVWWIRLLTIGTITLSCGNVESIHFIHAWIPKLEQSVYTWPRWKQLRQLIIMTWHHRIKCIFFSISSVWCEFEIHDNFTYEIFFKLFKKFKLSFRIQRNSLFASQVIARSIPRLGLDIL